MNVLPTVAEEVCKRCRKRDADTSLPVAQLLVRVMLLNEPRDASGCVAMSAQRIDELVDRIVANVIDMPRPTLSCLHLQSTVGSVAEKLEADRRMQAGRHSSASRRLLGLATSKRDAREVMSGVLLYVLHEMKMLARNPAVGESAEGVADEEQSRRETLAVLASVLPRSAVAAFVAQRQDDKERQIQELWRIVWGIRIFNRETGRGGAGVTDMVAEAEEVVERVGADLQSELLDVSKYCNEYSAVLRCPSTPLDERQRSVIMATYVYCLQVRRYLQVTLGELAAISERLNGKLVVSFRGTLQELQKLVELSSEESIVKSSVYPLFVHLADMFAAMAACKEEVAAVTASAEYISAAFAECDHSLLLNLDADAALKSLVPEPPANIAVLEQELLSAGPAGPSRWTATHTRSVGLADEGRRHGLRGGEAVSRAVVQTAATPDGVTCYSPTMFELNGFCLGSLLCEEDGEVPLEGCIDPAVPLFPGFLLFSRTPAENGTTPTGEGAPSSEENSFLSLRDVAPSFFCFSGERALRWVAQQVREGSLTALRLFQVVQRQPGLAHLLALAPYLPKEVYLPGTRNVERIRLSSYSVSVGTQTGQIDPYKDHQYHWNEWELRRLAVKLANLKGLRTHGSQTTGSHCKRDAETQVYPLRTIGVQTMVDAAIQPERVVRYIKGLRGAGTSRIEAVSSTIQPL